MQLVAFCYSNLSVTKNLVCLTGSWSKCDDPVSQSVTRRGASVLNRRQYLIGLYRWRDINRTRRHQIETERSIGIEKLEHFHSDNDNDLLYSREPMSDHLGPVTDNLYNIIAFNCITTGVLDSRFHFVNEAKRCWCLKIVTWHVYGSRVSDNAEIYIWSDLIVNYRLW